MNIILKSKFGSTLYGTQTPNSDVDYKGMYIAPLADIILKKDKETIQYNSKSHNVKGERNSKDDTDFEIIELRKFLKDALTGQTYAIDMLFTPSEFIDVTSNVWKYIQKNRDKIISKNMKPFMGYCYSQSSKYSLKGTRLGEINRIVDHIKRCDHNALLGEVMSGFSETDHIKRIQHEVRQNGKPIMETWWEIVSKKFPMNVKAKLVIEGLEKFTSTYGKRAHQAQDNDGCDWKAISHAYRCMYELEEIALFGKVTFPLKSAEKVKAVKMSKIPYSVVQDELPELMKDVTEKLERSTIISNEPDVEFWNEFIVKTYLKNA